MWNLFNRGAKGRRSIDPPSEMDRYYKGPTHAEFCRIVLPYGGICNNPDPITKTALEAMNTPREYSDSLQALVFPRTHWGVIDNRNVNAYAFAKPFANYIGIFSHTMMSVNCLIQAALGHSSIWPAAQTGSGYDLEETMNVGFEAAAKGQTDILSSLPSTEDQLRSVVAIWAGHLLMRFIAAHEVGHIMLSHLDALATLGLPLSLSARQNATLPGPEQAIYHTLEFEADAFAIKQLMNDGFLTGDWRDISTPAEMKLMRFQPALLAKALLFGIGVFVILVMFCEQKSEASATTHPAALERFWFILDTVQAEAQLKGVDKTTWKFIDPLRDFFAIVAVIRWPNMSKSTVQIEKIVERRSDAMRGFSPELRRAAIIAMGQRLGIDLPMDYCLLVAAAYGNYEKSL